MDVETQPDTLSTSNPAGNGPWLVLSILVGIFNVLLAYGMGTREGNGGLIGYVIGSALFWPGVAALLVAHQSRWKVFFLVSLLMMLTQCAQVTKAIQDERRDLEAITNAVEGSVDASEATLAGGQSVDSDPVIPERPKAGDNDIRKFRYVIETHAAQQHEIDRKYQVALEAAGISTLLGPDTLQTEAGRANTRRRLTMITDAIDILESRTWEIYDEIPRTLKGLGVSQKGQQDFERGKAESLPEAKERMQKYISLQHRFVAIAGELVSFFESLGYTPKLENDQWKFQSEDDIHRYQALVELFNERDRAEEVILRADADARKARVQKARDLLKSDT